MQILHSISYASPGLTSMRQVISLLIGRWACSVTVFYKIRMQLPPGGSLQLPLYGVVWPQDWKIDPSAD